MKRRSNEIRKKNKTNVQNNSEIELTTDGIENSPFEPKKVLSGIEKLMEEMKRNEKKIAQYYVLTYNEIKDSYSLERVYNSFESAESYFGLHIDETYNLFEPQNYYLSSPTDRTDSELSMFIVSYDDLKEFTLIDEDKLKYIPEEHEYFLYRVFVLLKNLGIITTIDKSEVQALEYVLKDCKSYYDTLSTPSDEESNLLTANKLLNKIKLMFGNKYRITLLIDKK